MDASKMPTATLHRLAEDQTTQSGNGGAVLADMDALQAEIDALRARYGQKR